MNTTAKGFTELDAQIIDNDSSGALLLTHAIQEARGIMFSAPWMLYSRHPRHERAAAELNPDNRYHIVSISTPGTHIIRGKQRQGEHLALISAHNSMRSTLTRHERTFQQSW